MITNDDIQKLVSRLMDVFATKFELQFELRKIREEMATKEEQRKVMGLVESVFTEVKIIREEQHAHFAEHRLISDRLDKIEQVPLVAQMLDK